MSTFISTEVRAEDVLEAMNADGVFAEEMWKEMNRCLHMGVLLDDWSDIVQGSFSDQEKRIMLDNLDIMKNAVERHIESAAYLSNMDIDDNSE